VLQALADYAVKDSSSQLPMALVDIGANFKPRTPVSIVVATMRRAAAAGVTRVLLTGTSVASSRAAAAYTSNPALAPADTGVNVFFTAGIHPHQASEYDDDGAGTSFGSIRELHADARCVAVGETGLDYDRMFSPREAQLLSFEAHVKLAVELNKPLFLHERDKDHGPKIGSHADLVAVLDKHRAALAPSRVCIHCFTASREDLQDYVRRGYLIGVTGFVAMEKRGRHLREAIAAGALPLERLMIETDAPYMMPDGVPLAALAMQPRANEPCTLPTTVRALARCYGVSEQDVAAATTKTACDFFGI
jgi:TatD DNase family protein